MAREFDNSIQKAKVDFEGQLEKSLADEVSQDLDSDKKFMEAGSGSGDEKKINDAATQAKLERWEATERERSKRYVQSIKGEPLDDEFDDGDNGVKNLFDSVKNKQFEEQEKRGAKKQEKKAKKAVKFASTEKT